ncbi:LytTR family DNA-binding domain-containing protein [Pedobacter ureilyticus]|uniref:LytTR family DNA-binding domain-containing protein n=1 Tax=Pedobacter ureilyticus TaxID=1393051 RepID=A0ABW9J4I7_9SPHI|nr:LytTR family DNA-binding domain-containing protein [Pedobacter helvus]
MKKPSLGKFPYFGRMASLLLAAIATFCILMYAEKPAFTFLLTKINFYTAWLFNTLIAYAMVRASIYGTRLLDSAHPWQRSYRKRWPKQLLLAISMPLLLGIIGIVIYFIAYGKNILETNFFRRYLFLDTMAIFLLNGTLFFMHQQQANKRIRPERSTEEEQLQFPIPIEDIAYLYAENKYCFAISFDGAQEYLEVSLTKALAALPLHQFCLVRRSHIVNRKAIKQVVKKNNTRLLKLLPELDQQIMVSRLETPAFNIWWEATRKEKS